MLRSKKRDVIRLKTEDLRVRKVCKYGPKSEFVCVPLQKQFQDQLPGYGSEPRLCRDVNQTLTAEFTPDATSQKPLAGSHDCKPIARMENASDEERSENDKRCRVSNHTPRCYIDCIPCAFRYRLETDQEEETTSSRKASVMAPLAGGEAPLSTEPFADPSAASCPLIQAWREKKAELIFRLSHWSKPHAP